MRLTFFVAWKSWASNRLRTVLTVFGVALGIAVVTAIHVLDHNTIQSRLQQRLADYGRVDLELQPLDPTRSPDEIRRQLIGMSDFVSSVGLLHGGELGASIQVSVPGQSKVPVSLYGLSPLPSRSFAFYNVAAGADLTDLDGDRFVLVAQTLAERLELDIGDHLVLEPTLNSGLQRCVDGEWVTVEGGAEPVEVEIKGIMSHHALARRRSGMVVVGSFNTARRIAPQQPSYYQVNRVSGSNPDLFRQELRGDFHVLDKRSAMLGEGADERAFRNGIKILGLLALVMGMLVVFQTLAQTLLERLRQIGLMRCLGASRRSVAAIFLADGLLLAVVGAVLGVGTGIGLAYTMGRLQWTTLGLGKEILGFEVPPRPVLLAMGLGVFFTLAGSAFPLFKARNLPPLQVLQARGLGDSGYLLRGVNIFLFILLVVVLPVAYLAMTPLLSEAGQETQYVFLQVVGIVLLSGGLLLVSPVIIRVGGGLLLSPMRRVWPLPVFLVEKALVRGPGRFAAAVCSLAIVLVALIALKHISYSLRAEVAQFSTRTMDDHVFFEGDPRRPEDIAAIQAIPGVRAVEFFEGEVDAGFLLRGLSVDALVSQGRLFDGNPESAYVYRRSRSLVVSKRWAELHWKQAGQEVSILTGSGTRRYRVLLVSDDAGFFPDEKVWAVAAPGWLRLDFCVEEASVARVAVELAPGTDPNAIRAQVGEIFDHSWFKVGGEIKSYLLRDVTRDFFLFDVLLSMILVLVGAGMVNTMTIAALGRAREIGVLRALGMDDRHLRRSFLLEGLVVAALATVLAFAMGLPLGTLIVDGLNRVTGLEAPVAVPWLYLALVPVLALVTGALAALLPGSRAVAIDPAQAVRYE